MKTCSKCNETKQRSEYHRDSSKGDGLCPQCKECKTATNLSWTAENRERQRETTRRWQEENKEQYAASKRSAHPKRAYGITLEQHDAILTLQRHQCAICYKPAAADDRTFHIDHCHTTGEVRGILCPKCNKGLGLFDDLPEVIMNAAKYVSTPAELRIHAQVLESTEGDQ